MEINRADINSDETDIYCNGMIQKAFGDVKANNYKSAESHLQKALYRAQTNKDDFLQILIYQMLGNCLRLESNYREAWINFIAGWELIEAQGEDAIRKNMIFRVYAIQMYKVGPYGYLKKLYLHRFKGIWGKDWMDMDFEIE